MVKKLLVLILLILISKVSLGCALGPETRPEYDTLIKISGPNSKDIYSVTAPKNLASTKYLPIMTLIYTNSNEKTFERATYNQEIKTEIREDMVVGNFLVSKGHGNKAYVYVLWSPDGYLCALYGYSNFIKAK
jgi:hypothetical protein